MAAGRFLIQRRDQSVNEISIESDGLTIGRLPGNELVLNHRAVDETHAGIKEIAGRYWIFNLSSNNGIVINGVLAERAQIADGDLLQAGPYLLRFTLAPQTLIITVDIGAGWRLEEAGPEVTRKPDAAGHDTAQAQSLQVFWEKRKRESGKILDQTVLDPRGQRRLGKALACWVPTLDLRKPWTTAWIFWGTAAALVFGVSALAAWRNSYTPGAIAAPHTARAVATHAVAIRAAGGACSACHSPLSSMQAQCVSCHQVAGFATPISTAHVKAGMTCATCHREHSGAASSDGLLSDGICLQCHTGATTVKDARRAGEVLGDPHPVTRGYPVVNGVWKWTGLSTAVWKSKGLPESYAKRPAAEQFHAIHRAVRIPEAGLGRMDCGVCHGEGVPKKEQRPLALQHACGNCHAATGTAAASSAGCVSCHPPHGSTREAQMVLSGLQGRFDLLPQHVKLERSALMRTPLAPAPKRRTRIGALSLAGWIAVFFVPAIAGLIFLSRSSVRLRSSLASIEAEPNMAAAQTASASGPGYPHPVVDPTLCIGCYACVNACPHDVLAIVNGIATPVALDQCMEDTACMAECPTSPKACVVVNTNKIIPPRKVPRRDQNYLTDVPGIYLIGDVSGVPLIKNAINEGADVIQNIVGDLRAAGSTCNLEYDVAIIGAGPAGFSAAVCASDQGLKYLALDQKRVANTIRSYPAGKYVFFKPDTAAVKGLVPIFGVGTKKEDLLRSWDELAARIQVREMERCTAIQPSAGGFQIKTQAEAGQAHVYTARRVILAIGNLGTPMKLGVPGEDTPKVKYSLSDPDDYVNHKCMVVGAGNSAIEAAVDLTGLQRHGDEFIFTRTNEVTLVVRSDFKGDLKLGNKMNIFDCIDAGRIKVHFRTVVKQIGEGEVVLADAKSGEEKARIANDFIFALIGSERPTRFLQSLGVQIEGDVRRSR